MALHHMVAFPMPRLTFAAVAWVAAGSAVGGAAADPVAGGVCTIANATNEGEEVSLLARPPQLGAGSVLLPAAPGDEMTSQALLNAVTRIEAALQRRNPAPAQAAQKPGQDTSLLSPSQSEWWTSLPRHHEDRYSLCPAVLARSRPSPPPQEVVSTLIAEDRKPWWACRRRRSSASDVGAAVCPVDQSWCAGCASFTGTSCTECLGGFMLEGGRCTACSDVAGWEDIQGQSCVQASCSSDPFQGLSSNQACCKCGGGQRAATRFSYVAPPLILGSGPANVTGGPVPRTAERYSLDSGCKLPQYGLTINGATGQLQLAADCPRVGCRGQETPFSVQCTITAHQTEALNATAQVQISAEYFAYESPVLVVTAQQTSFAPRAPLDLGQFRKTCAPTGIDEWLQLDSVTGVLIVSGTVKNTSSGVTGALGLADSVGGICQISALNTTSNLERQVRVVILDPDEWKGMAYPVPPALNPKTSRQTQLFAALGEASRTVQPKPTSGRIKPTRFLATCASDPPEVFVFDVLTGVATLKGYQVFTLDPVSGALRVAPSKGLSSVLDTAFYHNIVLTCQIIGQYEWKPGIVTSNVSTDLALGVLDTACFRPHVDASFASEISQQGVSSSQCKSACRASPSCAFFREDAQTNGCVFMGPRCTAGGSNPSCTVQQTVTEKITNCSEVSSCLNLEIPGDWFLSGHYCPLGVRTPKGEVYQRSGVTSADQLYLALYDPAVDGQVSCVRTGQNTYLIKRPDPRLDFLQLGGSAAELHGEALACVDHSQYGWDMVALVFSSGELDITVWVQSSSTQISSKAQVAGPSCPALDTSNTTEGGPAIPDVSPLVFDDLGTPAWPDDFWLHPCECFPQSWGDAPPVTAASFSDVPAGSGNVFAPDQVELASGDVACDQHGLLPGTGGIQDSQSNNGEADCQSLCKSRSGCNFFFTGTSNSVQQCRLYDMCNTLVRIKGLSGTLFAMPQPTAQLCRIADPDKCWDITRRRLSLGAVTGGEAQALGAPPAASLPSCAYQRLLEQCDTMLLLSKPGVGKCAPCTYMQANSQPTWLHKRHPPTMFLPGTQLGVSCWAERYSQLPVASGSSQPHTLTCVAGAWSTNSGDIGLTGFECAACVQVSPLPYPSLQAQGYQELYFMSNREAQLLVDATPPKFPRDLAVLLMITEQGSLSPAMITAMAFQLTTKVGQKEVCLVDPGDKLFQDLPGSVAEYDSCQTWGFGTYWSIRNGRIMNMGTGRCLSWATTSPTSTFPKPWNFAVVEPCTAHLSCDPALWNTIPFFPPATCSFQWGFNLENGATGSVSSSLNSSMCLAASPTGGLPRDIVDVPVPAVQPCSGSAVQQWTRVAVAGPAFQLVKSPGPGPSSSASPPSGPGSGGLLPQTLENASIVTQQYQFSTKPTTCLQATSKQTLAASSCAVVGQAANQQLIDFTTLPTLLWNEFTTAMLPLAEVALSLGNSTLVAGSSPIGPPVQWQCRGGYVLSSVGYTAGSKGPVPMVSCTPAAAEGAPYIVSKPRDDLAPMSCAADAALSMILKNATTMTIACFKVSALGSCRVSTTQAVPIADVSGLVAHCVAPDALQSVVPQQGYGDTLSYRITCCNVGGLPTALAPTGSLLTTALRPWEGVYCPRQRDASGRLEYAQQSSFQERGAPSHKAAATLAFDESKGQWCLSGAGCAAGTAASPLDSNADGGATWQAVEVTDFTRGGPQHRSNLLAMPTLIKFTAVQPKTLEECKADVTPGSKSFSPSKQAQVSNGLYQGNPCGLMAGSQSLGLGSWTPNDMSSSNPSPMESGVTYDSTIQCFKREGARNKRLGGIKHTSSALTIANSVAKMFGDGYCSYIPDDIIGLAVVVKPGFPCKTIVDGLSTVADNIIKANLADETYNKLNASSHDCKGLQQGFARIFCDLHCIRSFVQSGNQAILTSLEKAVSVVDQNMQNLVEWSTGTVLQQLTNKGLQSTAGDAMGRTYREVRAMLSEVEALARDGSFDAAGTATLTRALNSFASASASHDSNATDMDAVLVRLAELHRQRNEAGALVSAAKLADKQRLTAAAQVEQRVAQFAETLQALLASRNELLGIYEESSSIGKEQRRSATRLDLAEVLDEVQRQGTRELLLDLDETWWALRAKLDDYLSAAKGQVEAFAHIAGLLEAYTAQCSVGLSSLHEGYTLAAEAEDKAHRALQETWTAAVPLFGLLASKVVDGDTFVRLARYDAKAWAAQAAASASATDSIRHGQHSSRDIPDPCVGSPGPAQEAAMQSAVKAAVNEGLSGQTLQQLRVAANEMIMLQDRFEFAGLGEPFGKDTVLSAWKRVELSYKASHAMLPSVVEEVVSDMRHWKGC